MLEWNGIQIKNSERLPRKVPQRIFTECKRILMIVCYDFISIMGGV